MCFFADKCMYETTIGAWGTDPILHLGIWRISPGDVGEEIVTSPTLPPYLSGYCMPTPRQRDCPYLRRERCGCLEAQVLGRGAPTQLWRRVVHPWPGKASHRDAPTSRQARVHRVCCECGPVCVSHRRDVRRQCTWMRHHPLHHTLGNVQHRPNRGGSFVAEPAVRPGTVGVMWGGF